MDKKLLIACVPAMFLWASCTDNPSAHFISDTAYRAQVETDFQSRQTTLSEGNLFAVFNQPMTPEEKEAMSFLYAYMPVGDMADCGGEFFLKNVRTSFRARQEMPWGKQIPEDIFRHFVLPIRVNNETLDESRMVFYQELKDRVKGLSLQDAVLEINHWCHEKVVYTPSDARTSSPLASVKTAYGRCGEESTFTVAALRSAGIPARQVYTPRWAHTDDNHAWVEAWVDGQWCFLGACEPEPVLNLGWFNAPASRGMLMHTKVFGKYQGSEEVMLQTPLYTEINVTGNYADTAKATIKVVDANQQPVPDACVEFKVYNYAEFYTVARKTTDADGETFLTSGKGDMLVWASKDGRFGYGKVSFGRQGGLTVALDKEAGETCTVDLDIVPPPENAELPEVTPGQRAENTRRMAEEDSIRNAYVATFFTEQKAEGFAREIGMDAAVAAKLLVGSRGNHPTITGFLKEASSNDGQKEAAIDLLQRISAKDLRDVSREVLDDHLKNSISNGGIDPEIFARYVRNPRVANEMITPYKAFFQEAVPEADVKAYQADPMKLVEWVKGNIAIDEECNLGGAPISPEGVWKARTADKLSRDIFFVSLSRALGIPARIDEVTRKVQLFSGKDIIDIDFQAAGETADSKGTLQADYKPAKALKDPKYYSHFTISKLADGRLQLLNYEEGDADMGGGATWSNLLKKGTRMDTGSYLLTSGTRMANGTVLVQLTFFNIEEGKTTRIHLNMRESKDGIQVIGNFNSENKYISAETGEETSLLATTGRGYYVVAILGARQEPTNHALRDIAAVKGQLEAWGRKMVLLFPDEEGYKEFDPAEFKGLPGNIVYGIDKGHAIQKEMAAAMNLEQADALPIFIIADTFNRVVFASQGYTVGLGAQMMQVIHKL